MTAASPAYGDMAVVDLEPLERHQQRQQLLGLRLRLDSGDARFLRCVLLCLRLLLAGDKGRVCRRLGDTPDYAGNGLGRGTI